MKKHKQLLVQLLLVNGVGPVLLYRFLQHYGAFTDISRMMQALSVDHALLEEALETFLQIDAQFLTSSGLCLPKQAQEIAVGLAQSHLAVQRELELAEQHGVAVDTPFDQEYPALLRHSYAPPYVLYRFGADLSKQQKTIAVVGARKATLYAQRALEKLLPPVIERGWHIVSGGALGVDTWAHHAALTYGGTTTVVMGSGLLKPYPTTNANLFELVAGRGGTVVSNFPLEMRPDKGTFPSRNRIIAALSRATLVVQAAVQSGSLITASYALEAGRSVCAVPGPIDDELSVGCHGLLRQGAALIAEEIDLLRELGEPLPKKKRATEVQITLVPSLTPLTEEQKLLKFIAENDKSAEEIALFLQKDAVEVQNQLFDMQLEGKIVQTFAGMWRLS